MSVFNFYAVSRKIGKEEQNLRKDSKDFFAGAFFLAFCFVLLDSPAPAYSAEDAIEWYNKAVEI